MFLVSLDFFSTGAGAQQATMVPKGPGKMMLILFLALGTDLLGIWENTKPPHLWKAAQWAQLKLPFLPSGQSQSFFNLVRAQAWAQVCQELWKAIPESTGKSHITGCICGCRKLKLVLWGLHVCLKGSFELHMVKSVLKDISVDCNLACNEGLVLFKVWLFYLAHLRWANLQMVRRVNTIC